MCPCGGRRFRIDDRGRLQESERAAPDGGFNLDLQSILSETRLLFTVGFVLTFVILYGTYYRGLLTILPDMIGDLPGFEVAPSWAGRSNWDSMGHMGLLIIGILGQYADSHVTDAVRTEYALLSTLGLLALLAVAFLSAASVGILPFLALCAAIGFCLYATAPIY